MAADLGFQFPQPVLVVEDLKDAIGRRGPDSLGFKKVFLTLKSAQSSRKHGDISVDILFECYFIAHAADCIYLRLLTGKDLIFR